MAAQAGYNNGIQHMNLVMYRIVLRKTRQDTRAQHECDDTPWHETVLQLNFIYSSSSSPNRNMLQRQVF
ncbi:hypothetical protein HMPREF0650_1272 [Hoylesella buccalis ATCC 35310]|uniref:Uncharacterized protein n=1 Tax=Hoylesella buccalis ATCC 35310 TaxID=679190 RepID=D1W478_9BACT|nr:hypothetical protein HMPREF0650_1272 [Hoylesella buccalis ATCC 35310]